MSALVEKVGSSDTGDNIEFRPYRRQVHDQETAEEGNVDDMLGAVTQEYEETPCPVTNLNL